MYEAVPSSTSIASGSAPEDDPELAKFLPMLQEYLKVSDSLPSSVSGQTSDSKSADDDDYVWDVFYSRPAAHKELLDRLNVGMV